MRVPSLRQTKRSDVDHDTQTAPYVYSEIPSSARNNKLKLVEEERM